MGVFRDWHGSGDDFITPNLHAVPLTMLSSGVTAIVNFQVLPEREGEFLKWQEHIGSIVKGFPGFVSRQLKSPAETGSKDWMVLYRFASRKDMERWFKSDERAEFMAKTEALLAEPAKIQFIETDQAPDHVCVVFAHHVKPGHEEEFRAWQDKATNAQREMGVLVKAELFPPVEGLEPSWVTVLSFNDRQSVDRWLESPERKALLKELEPMVDDFTIQHIGTGLEGWFTTGGDESAAAIPEWKQVLMVLLALYPTVMLLTIYVSPLMKSWTLNWSMLVGNLLSVSILTYILMRHVSQGLKWWTNPSAPSVRNDLLGALTVVGLLILMAFLFRFIISNS